MRQRRLKRLWAWLQALQQQRPTDETLLLKLGAARQAAGRVQIALPPPPAKTERQRRVDFTFTLDAAKLRQVRRREDRYLLRSNLTATDPAQLWEYSCTSSRSPRCSCSTSTSPRRTAGS